MLRQHASIINTTVMYIIRTFATPSFLPPLPDTAITRLTVTPPRLRAIAYDCGNQIPCDGSHHESTRRSPAACFTANPTSNCRYRISAVNSQLCPPELSSSGQRTNIASSARPERNSGTKGIKTTLKVDLYVCTLILRAKPELFFVSFAFLPTRRAASGMDTALNGGMDGA